MPHTKKKNGRKTERLHRKSRAQMNNNNNETNQTVPVWDGVEEAMVNCRAFFVLPAQIAPFVRDESLAPFVDQGKVADHLKTLDKDVTSFKEKLEAIHNRHRGRKGPALDPDDHMKALVISEEYFRWAQSYESVVLPTIAAITDLYAEASEKALMPPTDSQVETVLAQELHGGVEPGNQTPSINEVISNGEVKGEDDNVS